MIYSPTLELHLLQLRIAFETLRADFLYAKRSKCFFGENQEEYLGHIISERGVATGPKKIEVMQNCLHPLL